MCTPLKWLHLELNTLLLLMPSSELSHKTTLSTKKAGKYDFASMPTDQLRIQVLPLGKKGKEDTGKQTNKQI